MKAYYKTASTNKNFSSFGGLFLYHNLMDNLHLESKLSDLLPKNKITPKTISFEKIKSLIYGFISGADCLDDINLLKNDHSFKALVPHYCSSNTLGDFLRSFSKVQMYDLNLAQLDIAMKLRKLIPDDDKKFILDLDSTDHIQYAKKMEGLGYNYKDHWGLDSLQAYDQFGIQYWYEVREGGTHTSVGAETAIHHIFKKVPNEYEKYFRADSGYASNHVFEACDTKGVKFVIVLRRNMYQKLLKTIYTWKPTYLRAKDGRDCEIANTIYHSPKSNKQYRVTIMRAKKKSDQLELDPIDRYDYFACISNIDVNKMNNHKMIEFYRKRGNAENFIKEKS